MTTHVYLKQIDRFDRMIHNKRLEIEDLRTNATNVTVASDSERVKSSGNKDKIGSMAVLIADLENEIKNLEIKRKTILSQIDSIANIKQYDTLVWFYILHKDIIDIADHLNCSESNVKRLKGLALKEFERKYGVTYLNITPDYTKMY